MTAANIRHQYRIHRQQASIRRQQRHPMTIATDDNRRPWQPTTMAATAARHEWKATHDGNNNDNSNQQMTTGEQMKNGTPINYKHCHSQTGDSQKKEGICSHSQQSQIPIGKRQPGIHISGSCCCSDSSSWMYQEAGRPHRSSTSPATVEVDSIG